MKRWLFFIYGAANYFLFFAVYGYLCLFTANLFVPRTIDRPASGLSEMSPGVAAGIDLALLAAFGLQHSIMARPAFKRVWTRFVPQPIERATYMLASCAALTVAVAFWQPLPAVLWNIVHPAVRAATWALFVGGWLMVPAVSFMINHFDLFGVRQVWLHLRQRQYESLPFNTPLLYAHVRHPLYIGWAIAFWATPTMTAGHALFAATLTGYMVLATFFEERNLVAYFGQKYEDYQMSVPKFIPRLVRRSAGQVATRAAKMEQDRGSPAHSASMSAHQGVTATDLH